ncbi:MAG: RHS repeat protein, partial [Bacteroidetes bacterium]|nr:RHS repeat protein [Bacteroidota bacterium]
SGNVLRVDYGTGDDQMHHRYTYDADNRITEVETSADAVVWHQDAEYFYYPHGPLQRMELGEHKVQGVDYAYTLQGWLKGINSDVLIPKTDMGHDGVPGNPNAHVGRDAYAESIGYFGDEDYKAIDASRWGGSFERPFAAVGTSGTLSAAYNPLYNGNIAHTVNALQPWGGWTSPTQPAQVLAQVYRYDQLNRLKQAQGVEGLTATNTWNGVTDATADRYKSAYTYDANGNIETVGRFDGDGNMYDAMNYGYHTDAYGRKLRNRPYNIQDLADQDGDYAQDIPQMAYQPDGIVDPQDVNHTINTANNFSYDVLGQRIKDKKADIELIEWTVSGKMKRVQHTAASGKPDITFAYDAAGNRIMKQVGDPDLGPATGYREHYVLDAQGNIMAIYRSQPEPVPNTSPQQYAASLKVVERPIYGSKRIGSYTRAMELVGEPTVHQWPYTQPMQAPLKHYELTDHLGNVATVVTGRLLPLLGLGVQYQAEVVSATLHEPFGLELTGMNWHSNVSRFGFQSQIKDLELNAIHFKYREYSPADGIFSSIDPLTAKYPYWTPYAFSGNRVIDARELEGLEPSGINPKTGVNTTANDANSPNGQWDTQLIYPKGSNPHGGGSWDKMMQNLYAIDRALDVSGKGQYEARKSDGTLKGGIGFTDQYAAGSNNADRRGDPTQTFDITGLRALTSLAGQGRPGPLRMGEPGAAGAATDAASGAIQAGVDPAQNKGAAPVLDAPNEAQIRANTSRTPSSPMINPGQPSVASMDQWFRSADTTWQDVTMSDGTHNYYTLVGKAKVSISAEQFNKATTR